jgi:hypothetical protein
MRRVREWMAGGRLPPGDIELLDPPSHGEGSCDGYQGMAAPPIVDPEPIVRLPFPPARL